MKYLTAAQIAELKLPGMPTTKKGVLSMAKRDGWESRPRSGKGGGVEFPVSALPKAAQKAMVARSLRETKANLPAQMELPLAVDLKNYQRDPMTARAVLLAEIDRLVLSGLGRSKAVEALVEMARTGELAPDLMRMIPLANARANSGRTLTRATIYNWLKARETAGGAVVALAPKEVQEAAIPAWADTFVRIYNRPTKPALTVVLEDMWPQDVERPSYDQARRFLKKLTPLARNSGRIGPRDLRKFKIYVARDVSELWPGAVFCGDGHTFKAEVAHPIHGRPFRPEITMFVDVFTRRIVGWSTALAENTSSVADALRHAVTSTTCCDILYYDNGSGAKNINWDDAVIGLAARLDITKEHSRAYNSQARGVIERRNSTVLHRAAQKLPTYVGQHMDREARQKAYKITRKDIAQTGTSKLLLPWQDFIQFVGEEIEAANGRECEGLPKIVNPETGRRRHMNPMEAWNQAIADGWQPDPISEADAADLFRPVEKRKTRRGMVELFGNEYFGGSALEALHDEYVLVSYDIHDAEKVWVRDMQGRMICEAIFGGNKQKFFPTSKAELAREARVKGKLRRLEAHADTANAELRAPMLDHAPAQVFEPLRLVEPEPVTITVREPLAEGQRPMFSSDTDLARWLIQHPDLVTDNDRNLLRTAMRSRNFLNLLDCEGVDVTTLREVLTTEEAA